MLVTPAQHATSPSPSPREKSEILIAHPSGEYGLTLYVRSCVWVREPAWGIGQVTCATEVALAGRHAVGTLWESWPWSLWIGEIGDSPAAWCEHLHSSRKRQVTRL